MSKKETNVYPSYQPASRGKSKEEGEREKGGRKGEGGNGGSGINCHITYLLKSTFLSVSAFNSGVPNVVGWVVLRRRILAQRMSGVRFPASVPFTKPCA